MIQSLNRTGFDTVHWVELSSMKYDNIFKTMDTL